MDNGIRAWWQAHKPTRRRLIQLYAALLCNANLSGFAEGSIYTGPLKSFCVPGLNCYSCPGAVGACPLGALQNALAASGTRAPFFVIGILMLRGLTLGRTICGWLCPAGLLQELIWKLPTPKLRKSRVTRVLSWGKYLILGGFVIILPLYYSLRKLPLPAFCKYICPAGTLEGAVALLLHPANGDKFSMLGALFANKFTILVLTMTVCVFVFRAFCRFLCPLGAIYSLFSRVALTGVKVDTAGCIACGKCIGTCRMDIRHVGDRECIHCGGCIDICPTKAIARQVGSRRIPPDRKPEKRRVLIAWVCALAVLGALMGIVNRPAPEQPVGMEVGMRCPDFRLSVYPEGEFQLREHSGTPVVINFWATWCAPCVAELPYFGQLAERYGDRICVIAVHSALVTEDVAAYTERLGFPLVFAQDASPGGNVTGDDTVIASLGGSTMLPMTVVLDADGTIVYNRVGAVTPELLEELVEPLLK